MQEKNSSDFRQADGSESNAGGNILPGKPTALISNTRRREKTSSGRQRSTGDTAGRREKLLPSFIHIPEMLQWLIKEKRRKNKVGNEETKILLKFHHKSICTGHQAGNQAQKPGKWTGGEGKSLRQPSFFPLSVFRNPFCFQKSIPSSVRSFCTFFTSTLRGRT